MKRLIIKDIYDWYKNDNNLILFIFGARQVGKTYIIKKFLKEYCNDNFIYINLMNKDEYYQQLKKITNPKKIIETIEIISNQKINNDTLIVFDEFQELDNLKIVIKLLVDENIHSKVICTGSYLSNSLNNQTSFPVGKIKILEMYPLNFHEFLLAKNRDDLINKIQISLKNKRIDQIYHDQIMNLYYEFLIVGGMPQVLNNYIINENIYQAHELKQYLINMYKQDIIKFIDGNNNKIKAQLIYDNIQNFVTKENKRFQLTCIDKNARFTNYEVAIQYLTITHIVHKINNINKFISPIKLHELISEFKLYYNDVGLLSSLFNLNQNILLNNKQYSNIKGFLCENFVFNELINKTKNISYYSFYDQNNNRYEIDFIIEDNDGNLIPIETKFGYKFNISSLLKLNNLYQINNNIVFSSNIYSFDKERKIWYLPVYTIGFLDFKNNRLINDLFNEI